jgi:hypothetical protein
MKIVKNIYTVLFVLVLLSFCDISLCDWGLESWWQDQITLNTEERIEEYLYNHEHNHHLLKDDEVCNRCDPPTCRNDYTNLPWWSRNYYYVWNTLMGMMCFSNIYMWLIIGGWMQG